MAGVANKQKRQKVITIVRETNLPKEDIVKFLGTIGINGANVNTNLEPETVVKVLQHFKKSIEEQDKHLKKVVDFAKRIKIELSEADQKIKEQEEERRKKEEEARIKKLIEEENKRKEDEKRKQELLAFLGRKEKTEEPTEEQKKKQLEEAFREAVKKRVTAAAKKEEKEKEIAFQKGSAWAPAGRLSLSSSPFSPSLAEQ